MAFTLDDFHRESRPRRSLCTIAKILGEVDKTDAVALSAALADANITHSAIERVLANNGLKVAQNTVARHRRGECACGAG